jgi:DNA-binding response OmpR family regulator
MGQKLLIVEDNDGARSALVGLGRHFGFEVSTAASVREALAQLDGHAAVLLDLNLPDGLGTDVLAVMRSTGHPARVAVWTARDDPETMREVQALRPDAVFIKPKGLDALLAWLQAIAIGERPE